MPGALRPRWPLDDDVASISCVPLGLQIFHVLASLCFAYSIPKSSFFLYPHLLFFLFNCTLSCFLLSFQNFPAAWLCAARHTVARLPAVRLPVTPSSHILPNAQISQTESRCLTGGQQGPFLHIEKPQRELHHSQSPLESLLMLQSPLFLTRKHLLTVCLPFGGGFGTGGRPQFVPVHVFVLKVDGFDPAPNLAQSISPTTVPSERRQSTALVLSMKPFPHWTLHFPQPDQLPTLQL